MTRSALQRATHPRGELSNRPEALGLLQRSEEGCASQSAERRVFVKIGLVEVEVRVDEARQEQTTLDINYVDSWIIQGRRDTRNQTLADRHTEQARAVQQSHPAQEDVQQERSAESEFLFDDGERVVDDRQQLV